MLLAQQEKGQAVPALDRRPTLLREYQWHYSCFEELALDRTLAGGGMGPTIPRPLTTGQIYTYYKAFRLAMYGVDFEEFYDGIRLIDLTWLQVVTERRTTAQGKASASGKSGPSIPKYNRPK